MRTIWGTAIAFLMLCSAAGGKCAHYTQHKPIVQHADVGRPQAVCYYDYCQRYRIDARAGREGRWSNSHAPQ